jgi:hypothetical protein
MASSQMHTYRRVRRRASTILFVVDCGYAASGSFSEMIRDTPG